MDTHVNEAAKIEQEPKHILLGQLGSFGDCLYATTIAHQIKIDFPECHLTWAIGSPFKSILDNNPHVDDIWEFPLPERNSLLSHWQQFEDKALEYKKKGDFDEIFLTQVFPNNLKNFDGTLRSSIFRAYPRPITVPVSPVVRLAQTEIENVRRFAKTNRLKDNNYVILFECSPKSRQSFVTQDFALEVAQILVNSRSDTCVVLSSNESFCSNSDRVIDGSTLSFRENLALFNYCNILVGGSSGVSWLSTSASTKKIPMIQLLEKKTFMYASFIHDFEFQGLKTEHIIEMTNCSPQKVVDCILLSISSGFKIAKNNYGEEIPVKFIFYWKTLFSLLLKGKFRDVYSSVKVTCNRWGFRGNFLLSFFVVLFICLWRWLCKVFRKPVIYK